ncbi:MAG: YvcK family protein [Tissierellales bacterium]|nr:YvcK family protein [Tissierellales bacterium]MBN2826947.1 YvcK family protein [Tissierellales bacterium]
MIAGKENKKVVILGGGTGLSIILRGLKKETDNITAVVTVADDGGGSGVLREDLGMLPPGDIRNCIISLADTPPIIESLMQHRFRAGYLKGQSFGNLFIAAMNEIYGDFEHALKELGNIFKIKGQVLPMTLEDTNLVAELESGDSIFGENTIPEYVKKTGDRIKKINLVPNFCEPLSETIKSIEEADIILIGPGSLYTSIIPNLLVDDIPELISKSKAKVFYICNLMTQSGETDDYNVRDHLEAIFRHSNQLRIDYIVVNDEIVDEEIQNLYGAQNSRQILLDEEQEAYLKNKNIKIIKDNFLDIEKNYVRHNAEKIAERIINYKASGLFKRN